MSAPLGQPMRALARASTGGRIQQQRALARAVLRRAASQAPAKAPARREEG